MRANLLRPLGVGELLDGAFTVYREQFARLFVTALILLLPLQMMSGLQDRLVHWLGAPELALLLVPLYLIGAFGFLILWPGQTWQIAEAVHGRESGFGAAVQRGLRSIPRLIGALILAAIAYGAAIAVVLMIYIVAALVFSGGGEGGLSGGLMAATIALIGITISGVVFASLFAVVPLVVIEGAGPLQAIKRSVQLSNGARLRILGVLLLSYLIVFLPMLGVMMLTGTAAALYDPEAALLMGNLQTAMYVLANVVVGALTTPFWIGCQTLLYYDRRVRAEAYDLEIAAEALAVAG